MNQEIYPTGDFIQYNSLATPDVADIINNAALKLNIKIENVWWFDVDDEDDMKYVIQDITGSKDYELDKVITVDDAKMIVTFNGSAYYIIADKYIYSKAL